MKMRDHSLPGTINAPNHNENSVLTMQLHCSGMHFLSV